MLVTAHLTRQKIAEFTCPNCNKRYRKDLSRFPDIGQNSKVKCKCACGNAFVTILDRRRHSRKPTTITGGYHHAKQQFRGLINVRNLSKSGAGIEINASRVMKVGDNLTLKFNLDDKLGSFVSKDAVIRKKDGNFLGVEFLEETWDQDPLAYYMRQ